MRRKKGLKAILAALIVTGLVGCSGSNSSNTGESANVETSDKPSAQSEHVKIVHFVTGKLGDKGFFDSADRGLKKTEYLFGFEASSVEGGEDSEAWPPDLEKLTSSGSYDVIIVGTSKASELVKELAIRYPEQKFMFYDAAIQGVPNVYAMLCSQSEGSFLAGAFAAMVTTSTELGGANPEKKIGFIGGEQIDIIHDFKSGYVQGATYIDPEIEVMDAYVGDFVNQKKAEELAAKQYLSGVDIIYNVAGPAGFGLLKAGNDAGKYTIGVDNNQNPLYPGSVLTSMIKSLDESVFQALSRFRGGSLPFGVTEVLGVKENGIGIARDELYEKHVPLEIKEKMKDIESKIASGEIVVKSSLDLHETR